MKVWAGPTKNTQTHTHTHTHLCMREMEAGLLISPWLVRSESGKITPPHPLIHDASQACTSSRRRVLSYCRQTQHLDTLGNIPECQPPPPRCIPLGHFVHPPPPLLFIIPKCNNSSGFVCLSVCLATFSENLSYRVI